MMNELLLSLENWTNALNEMSTARSLRENAGLFSDAKTDDDDLAKKWRAAVAKVEAARLAFEAEVEKIGT
jgi:hypothetical protein